MIWNSLFTVLTLWNSTYFILCTLLCGLSYGILGISYMYLKSCWVTQAKFFLNLKHGFLWLFLFKRSQFELYMHTIFGQKYPKPAIVCGRKCVVCDQLKNARTHAHRTHVLKVFSHAHAHVRPHIARVRARTHLRNSCLAY